MLKRILILSLTAVFLSAALLILHIFAMEKRTADASLFFTDTNVCVPQSPERPQNPVLPTPRGTGEQPPRPQPRDETL